jgi:outer membrane protein W
LKNIILILSFFFAATLCFGQTLGYSGAIAQYNGHRNTGYGANFEYGFNVSTNTAITLSATLLLANRKEAGFDLSYLQIPVTVGARYYIIRNIISPYIAVEIGASYSKIERVEMVKFGISPSAEEHQELVRYRNVNLGFGTAIGTLINISKEIDLNISARQYNVLYIPTSFLAWNVGIIYSLM